jgi:signal peptidase I
MDQTDSKLQEPKAIEPSTAPAKPEPETNVKETIESILVAFILAFIFRAYVVEAFVIPTGSMAPTLMGAHLHYRCPDCGYEFTVNFGTKEDDITIPTRANDSMVDSNGRPVEKVYHIICPNCGYRIQRHDPENPDNSATNPPVHYGDRILVLKYLYLFQDPKRWDVVVFKAPEKPWKYDYQQNYIKRLIGKPGETIMLLDGDVYVAPNDPNKDPTLDDFVVQTKPAKIQDALWRIVYDNDYYPQNKTTARVDGTEPTWKQPWTRQMGQDGWQSLEGREFNFNNAHGAADIFFDPSLNPAKQALTDWLAYDITVNQGPDDRADSFTQRTYTPDDNVSDVRLTFYYQRKTGDGPIRASLSKIDHTFIAELSQGKATLYQRIDDDPETVVASVPLNIDTTQPTKIDFVNCDYQVTLRVNDKQIIQTTPQQYHPDIHRLFDAFAESRAMPKPSIRISAADQACTVSHVSLWRDIYYMNRALGHSELTHAVPDNFPDKLMRLSKNPPEYFCCGDNSPISGDGRYWDTPINLPHENLFVDSGRVPGRFLLGKAFFVYWPAGFRPLDSAPAVIPNFGDMRFIH